MEGDGQQGRAVYEHGQPEVELFPESETRFFLKVVDAQVDFVKDDAGRVTGIVLHQGRMDLPAKRIQRP